MIPSIITDTSITFIAQGRPWVMASDHPKFTDIKTMLQSGNCDEATIIRLADVRVAVEDATQGAAVLSEDGLFLNGEKMSKAWEEKAHIEPDSTRVLLVNPGDRVRVQGDEDAPDGIYTVGEVDNEDANKRVYVESDEEYFGFVQNSSIVEILK